jgi:glutamate-5-semialdehyde dehydrogenase
MSAAKQPIESSALPAELDPQEALARRSKAASRLLASASTETKDRALAGMARALKAHTPAILEANRLDVQGAQEAGKNAAFLDRLALDEGRIQGMARAIEEVRDLPDPIGEVVDHWRRPNGLKIEKVRLPLGVVLMIYEARPNVTSDAAALCLKSGNAALLRGGSESARSNLAIAAALGEGIARAGLPADAVQVVEDTRRESLLRLLQLDGLIDLCIPRGGEGLIRFVAQNARIPVVKHYKGVCHVYVHGAAKLQMAQDIVFNAKVQRPGVCNAAECLLVDLEIAEAFLPSAGKQLVEAGVELRTCPTSLGILRHAGVTARPAEPSDFGQEFLDLVLAIRVVRDLDHALEHIARYGSEHTEAIVTQDKQAAARFSREVTSSGVIVNASTRFNDGSELGLGAEIGISTTRLHAFGPMGLRELTSQKYVVHGNGQVR